MESANPEVEGGGQTDRYKSQQRHRSTEQSKVLDPVRQQAAGKTSKPAHITFAVNLYNI